MNFNHAIAANVNLRVVGDEISGYSVDIHDGDDLIVTNTGEFSLTLSNLDASVIKEVHDWRASSYTKLENGILLEKNLYIPRNYSRPFKRRGKVLDA